MRTTVLIVGLAVAVLLTGCSSFRKSIDNINREESATGQLESFIQGQLVSEFHRPAHSVSCTPYVQDVESLGSATMTCVVQFTAGTSYTTPGTVTDNANDNQDPGYYSFSFNAPPPIDLTTAPLPGPAIRLAAASPSSLFLQGNLAPVVSKLARRFGSADVIVQLALYPGELIAVIADNNNIAFPVTVTYSGTLTVGPVGSFSGSRNGIGFSQLRAAVIAHLAAQIAARGPSVARFVLISSLPGQNAGWNIYLTSGSTRYQSLVLGDNLTEITPTGTHPAN